MPVSKVTWKATGKMPEKTKEKADDACARCVELLSTVIAALDEGKLGVEQLGLLNHYFILGVDNQAIPQALAGILTRTRDGLRDLNFELKIEYFNLAKKSVQGEMSIALAQFNNDNQRLRYMIHEGSHAFAATDDFADRGYVNNDGTFKQSGLTAEEAVNNADSFACFVVGFNGIALK